MHFRCLRNVAVAMVLTAVGCASSRSSGPSGSVLAKVDPGFAEAPDAPVKRPLRARPATTATGPTLDRQGCDPTGKATVQIKNGPNGQPAQWRYFAVVKRKGGPARVMKCEALDNNNDGFVDARFFYDDNGQLILEQRDLDFDGHAEVVADYSHFSAAHLVQAE
jgi:hypothetical protein